MEWNNRDPTNRPEETKFHSQSVPLTTNEFQPLFKAFSPPYFSWSPPNGPGFLAVGSANTITTGGADRFEKAITEATQLFPHLDYEPSDQAVARPRLFGGAAFNPDHTGSGPWVDFPSLQFFLPRIQVTKLVDQSFLTVTEPSHSNQTPKDTIAQAKQHLSDSHSTTKQQGPSIGELSRSVSKTEWNAQIQGVRERIAENQVQKVVLAQTLTAQLEKGLDEQSIIQSLKQSHPNCYQFLFSPTRNSTLFGSSPEQLITRKGLTIGTGALAGSIGRGASPIEDEDLANDLCAKGKEQQEHSLVKDEIVANIKPYCAAVYCGTQRVMKLNSVQHLHSPISGLLTEPIHILKLVKTIHPSPAVGGIPPEKASMIINNTESNIRGWYASPVGWFDFNGNGDIVVSIRSAVRHKTEAILYAGAGIVEDSHPALEWDEVELKYQPVLDVLEP